MHMESWSLEWCARHSQTCSKKSYVRIILEQGYLDCEVMYAANPFPVVACENCYANQTRLMPSWSRCVEPQAGDEWCSFAWEWEKSLVESGEAFGGQFLALYSEYEQGYLGYLNNLKIVVKKMNSSELVNFFRTGQGSPKNVVVPGCRQCSEVS